jgi:hypothetical protein
VNTQGHEDVANEAGLPLLEAVFGKETPSLRALLLGNWLTDVSQAVDPVAYTAIQLAVARSVEGIVGRVPDFASAIDGLLREIIAAISPRSDSPPPLLRSFEQALASLVTSEKQWLIDKIDFLASSATDERDAPLALLFRSSFLLRGYFRFVHPDPTADEPRMPFEAFMQVFGRPDNTRGAGASRAATDRPGAYTQYYPHEHLDRPEVLPHQDPAIFAPGKQMPHAPSRLSPGQSPGTRSRSGRERLDPDLYSYLRDHIQMTAGLLAEVDASFRLRANGKLRDDDPEWYRALAKLGHALHQVEDFFAHSNWVELAVKRLGPEALDKVLPPATGLALVDRARTIYRRRLTRLVTPPVPDWRDPEDEEETWVVTGFFDIRDTLISLGHLAAHLWGVEIADPYSEGYQLVLSAREAMKDPTTITDEVVKLQRDTLEFFAHPTRAAEDPENVIAEHLRELFGDDIHRLARPGVPREAAEQIAREVSYLRDAPKEVRDAFFTVIVEGARYRAFRGTLVSLYGALKEIVTFVVNPLDWVEDQLPEQLQEILQSALVFYTQDRVADWIGADRVGCHSLLAKDHGAEPFYSYQKECATVVHWHVVNTLLRWKRNDAGNGPIDWLQLLEFFLRNPAADLRRTSRPRVVDIAVTIVHTVARGEQLGGIADPLRSLELRYRKTAIDPVSFSWRTIADANFGTSGVQDEEEVKRTINRILQQTGRGYAVTPPNYAFRPGTRILIPQQRRQMVMARPARETTELPWFAHVFEKGWKVVQGFEDEVTETSGPLQLHQPVAISPNESRRMIEVAKRLRQDAREAYTVARAFDSAR